MGKKELLEARRKREGLSMADIVQIEIRNKGITTDIREIIEACPPGSRGWSKELEKKDV